MSALPLTSHDSLVYREFAPLCAGIIGAKTAGTGRHDGRLLTTLTGHDRQVRTVAYSSDGLLLVSGSDDGTSDRGGRYFPAGSTGRDQTGHYPFGRVPGRPVPALTGRVLTRPAFPAGFNSNFSLFATQSPTGAQISIPDSFILF